MSDTVEKIQATITSDCICEDEYGNANFCYGCYGDSLEFLRDEVIAKWVEANGDDATNTVRVEGKSMTWQFLDGYKVITLDDVAESLNLRGDFRIVFTLNDWELTARRWSHDEPTGRAEFTFEFVDDNTEITH